MASIAPRTFPPPSNKFTITNPKFTSPLKQSPPPLSHSLARLSNSTICRCHNINPSDNSSDNNNRGWNYAIQEIVRNAIKKFDDYVNSYGDVKEERGSVEVVEVDDEEDWDWDRWTKHFTEIDEQELIVSILKSQLTRATNREDYEDAARLKVAIAAATTNDTVGKVMSHLKKAIEEECYEDAVFMRDYASAGLVGWWAGVSEDDNDPYGRIIRISAEHGRYIARSYSPRQLATARDGAPLFEIFLTITKKGEYKEQAVYLKRRAFPEDFPVASSKSFGPTISSDPLDPTTDKAEFLKKDIDDTEGGEDGDDDSDTSEGPGFDNILRDLIPGVKVKVLKVTAPSKVDRDLISKVVEQMMEDEDEDEDEDKDTDLESVDAENDGKGKSDYEQNEIAMDSGSGVIPDEGQSQIVVKAVVGSLAQKMSGTSHKDLLRVPARLEKKGRLSFCFTVEEDGNQKDSGGSGWAPLNKKLQGQRSIDHVMLDLAKTIGRGKIPMKVLKDVGKLLTLTLSQAQHRQPLSGSTTFNRIDIPASPDPLNGLYIGAHGLYTSEVIQIRRKFGQWQEDGGTNDPRDLEFYEYIEAVKLTGDPYVPAGQVAFRAKVGKKYQLPHKGMIPEELGVVARYKGQGRLAEPGFQNPRWVDGEVVILDGKYVKGGPVIGFVYWAPELHFLVFFNKLMLQK